MHRDKNNSSGERIQTAKKCIATDQTRVGETPKTLVVRVAASIRFLVRTNSRVGIQVRIHSYLRYALVLDRIKPFRSISYAPSRQRTRAESLRSCVRCRTIFEMEYYVSGAERVTR